MLNNSFLLISDYDPQVRSDILTIITDDTEGLRTQAERAAIAQVKTVLAYRHDVTCVFPVIVPFISTVTYTEGTNVLYQNFLYVALGDVTGVTPPVCWDATATYSIGDKVIINQVTYTVIQDTTPGIHPTDTAYFTVDPNPDWALSTSRNPYLIMILVDIVLYHLHSRISPNNIPKIRMDRYDEAIAWLKQVSIGEASLSECLNKDEDGEDIPSIPWGSKTRGENCW